MDKRFMYFWHLGWNGMEKRKQELINVPTNILTVDNWCDAEVGDLCINSEGQVDILKRIQKIPADIVFKARTRYHFEYSKKSAPDAYSVRVKKGKIFKRWNKIFKYKKPSSKNTQNELGFD